jgi:hypothetical protein
MLEIQLIVQKEFVNAHGARAVGHLMQQQQQQQACNTQIQPVF